MRSLLLILELMGKSKIAVNSGKINKIEHYDSRYFSGPICESSVMADSVPVGLSRYLDLSCSTLNRPMYFALCLLLAASALSAQEISNPVGSASALIRTGKYQQAHEFLSGTLTEHSPDPRLWTLDGLALAHLGREHDALKSFGEALRLAPQYLPALEGAGELTFKLRKPEAPEMLRQIVALRPGDETSHAMLATLAFERGDCRTAAAEFAASERLISSQPVALAQRGACLIRLHRAPDAIGSFQQLARLRPGNASVQYNLALSQFQAGQFANAISTLTALPPAARDADVLDLLSDAYEHASNTAAAVATLREAIVLQPDAMRLYVHFADLCLAHASFQTGVEMLNVGLQRSPEAAPLYLARGILQVQLAHYDAADADFARAETLDPNAQYTAAVQGMAKLQQNHLSEAANSIRQRIQEKPNDAFLHYLLAETLARSGATPGGPEFQQAIQAAKRAVQLDPKLGLARDVLARLYLQAGKLEEAMKESRLALAADPNDQTALYHLISALRKAGKKHEIPELAKKLTALRAAAQQQEISERRYVIVASNPK